MNSTNNNNQSEEPGTVSHSRRDFIVSAAAGAAAIGAVNLLNLQTANAANTRNALAVGDGPYPAEGMAAYSPTGPHKLMRFQRRALGPKDVAIKIHYCGVCHSDIHTIRGDWGKIQYPQIVGHELAGEVVAVGSSVSKFNVGTRVGVGKVVDSNEIGQMNLVLYGNALAGSNTGGIRETQDFIDFCALNKIKPEITKISMNGIDDAWTKVFEKKARYRYVIEMKA